MHQLMWISFFAVFYAYFGYPLVLAATLELRKKRTGSASISTTPTASTTPASLPMVTVIVTVRNEERVILEKLENTLSLMYAGETVRAAHSIGENAAKSQHVQIIVASDASDDATDEIVRSYAGAGVELVRLAQRGGKEQAQLEAVKSARGEIIVFTDAKIQLQADAVDRFVQYFSNPDVGIVSSEDRVESGPTGGSGEGMYVRYEMWLRALESDFLSLVGVSGSCFAVRKEICSDLRADIPSDFALLLASRRRKLRGVHAPDVIATYRAVATEEAEFQRKVRTVLRGISTLFACSDVLNPGTYGVFAWQVWSHKVMRWLVPVFLFTGSIAVLRLSEGSYFYSAVSVGLVAFYAAAALAFYDEKLRSNIYCKLPLFFMVVNAAIAVAWYHYLSGRRTVAWDPSAKQM